MSSGTGRAVASPAWANRLQPVRQRVPARRKRHRSGQSSGDRVNCAGRAARVAGVGSPGLTPTGLIVQALLAAAQLGVHRPVRARAVSLGRHRRRNHVVHPNAQRVGVGHVDGDDPLPVAGVRTPNGDKTAVDDAGQNLRGGLMPGVAPERHYPVCVLGSAKDQEPLLGTVDRVLPGVGEAREMTTGAHGRARGALVRRVGRQQPEPGRSDPGPAMLAEALHTVRLAKAARRCPGPLWSWHYRSDARHHDRRVRWAACEGQGTAGRKGRRARDFNREARSGGRAGLPVAARDRVFVLANTALRWSCTVQGGDHELPCDRRGVEAARDKGGYLPFARGEAECL